MCNCVPQYQGLLVERYKKDNPTHFDVRSQVQGIYATIIGNTLVNRGHADVKFTSKYPNKAGVIRDKTFTSSVAFNYCPFCGEKFDRSKEVNAITAATKTRDLILTVLPCDEDWPDHPSLSKLHILEILDDIIKGVVFTDKAHRYLGWAQAAVVASTATTLDDMKEINRSSMGAV